MELFVTCLRSLNRSKEGKNGGEKEVEVGEKQKKQTTKEMMKKRQKKR